MQGIATNLALLLGLLFLLVRNRALRQRPAECPPAGVCPSPPGPTPPLCFPPLPPRRALADPVGVTPPLVTDETTLNTAIAAVNANTGVGGVIVVQPVYIDITSAKNITEPCTIVCQDPSLQATFHQQVTDVGFIVKCPQFRAVNICTRTASSALGAACFVINTTVCNASFERCSFISNVNAIRVENSSKLQVVDSQFLWTIIYANSGQQIQMQGGEGDLIVYDNTFLSGANQTSPQSSAPMVALNVQSGSYNDNFTVNFANNFLVATTYTGPFRNAVQIDCALSGTTPTKHILLYNNMVQGVARSFLFMNNAQLCDQFEFVALLDNKVTYRGMQLTANNGPFPLVSFSGGAGNNFPAQRPTLYLNGNTLELNGASIAAYLPAASNAPVEQVGYTVMNAPSPLFEVLQEGGC